MTWAVRFEEVTKRYRGGGPRYASLRHDVSAGLRRVRRWLGGERPEPTGTLALDRVSFEVEEGESFAIIGPNGAGKSTALKILSRISYPTSGRVRIRGRVGALLEVGSGVHPELTARENIWLYGQILGMSREEVRCRFDEIVEFAELGHALDTPVKMYSSGMQLRLGFAIASHLDPDLFVVDEALAVGDAGFQAKCVERMTNIVAEGRTLLFVSHNLYAVETLCPRGIYLNGGRIAREGGIRDVLRSYLADVDAGVLAGWERSHAGAIRGGPLEITVRCEAADGSACVRTGETLRIVCEYACAQPGLMALFHFGVTDGRPGNLFLASQVLDGHAPIALSQRGTVTCSLPDLPLLSRVFELWGEVRLGKGWGNIIDWQPMARFRVEGGSDIASLSHAAVDAPIRIRFQFNHDGSPGGPATEPAEAGHGRALLDG